MKAWEEIKMKRKAEALSRILECHVMEFEFYPVGTEGL